MVHNVGLANLIRAGAIVENAGQKRVFFYGPKIFLANAACDRGVVMHAASLETMLSEDINNISVGAVVSSQLTP
jgi:hypothetical protein